MTAMGPPEPSPILRTRLDGGLRLVTEQLPGLRSAAIGFWVGVGAREEPADRNGASHFLEHLLFKGSERRSAQEIAESIESIGGDMNAFTAQELTAFTVRIPYDAVELAIDILCDIMWSPSLRPEEVEAERQVILEEIRMRDDAPDEVVHDLFSEALFPGHVLGREVLGTRESIVGMGRDEIAHYHATRYLPREIVVAAAGNIHHDEIAELLAARAPADDARAVRAPLGELPPPRSLALVDRATEQANVVLGLRGLARDDPDRYALTVLDHAFGGGMSSRLFQEIRERRGLAYAVYSYRAGYRETGAFASYVGTAPEHVDEVLDVLAAELDRLASDGLSERELAASKGNLLGSIALSLESSASRMHRIGRAEIILGEVPTLDELAASIEAVGPDEVARVVERVVANRPRTLAVVGPFDETAFAARVA